MIMIIICNNKKKYWHFDAGSVFVCTCTENINDLFYTRTSSWSIFTQKKTREKVILLSDPILIAFSVYEIWKKSLLGLDCCLSSMDLWLTLLKTSEFLGEWFAILCFGIISVRVSLVVNMLKFFLVPL